MYKKKKQAPPTPFLFSALLLKRQAGLWCFSCPLPLSVSLSLLPPFTLQTMTFAYVVLVLFLLIYRMCSMPSPIITPNLVT